jgi:formate dehydrogenase
LVATVDGGRLVDLKPNKDHVLSEGFMCVKGRAMAEIVHDTDRVLQPLRRVGPPGHFEPVTWDDALGDIAERLRSLVDREGPDSMAVFAGNPPAFDFATYLWIHGFQKAVGSRWKYGVNGEDAASRNVASHLLYGSPAVMMVPDFWRSQLVVIIGANPVVSKGSLVTEPRIRDALSGVVERGGRVVVIDPRRSETARLFEHVPVHAGTDAWLLGAVIGVLLDEDLYDRAFVGEWTRGLEQLRSAVSDVTPERAAERCGVPADQIVALARDLAGSPAAVVYGRTGTCTQQFGTLTNFLQDVINILTGHLDRPGGWVFGWGPVDFARFAKAAGLNTYGSVRTRARGLPDVLGMLPSQGFAEDIELPGPGQIRAVCMIGANPVRSSGAGGARLERALGQLELFFSLDLYVNESNKHAHYVLPVTSMYEREDLPFTFMGNMLRPALWATDPVLEPLGSSRADWTILDEIARRMGLGGAYSFAALRFLARLGVRLSPRVFADLVLRTSSEGDRFGLRRRGWSYKKLKAAPNGVRLRDELPTGVLAKKLVTTDKKVDLAPMEILAELDRLRAHERDTRPFRLLGMREVRSHNSWMHNSPRLAPEGRSMGLHVHPSDAARLCVADGDIVRVTAIGGAVEVPVVIDDDMFEGNVALPHGWGHDAGWRRANALGGRDSNELAGTHDGGFERLSGMSVLNGIPVTIGAVEAGGESGAGEDVPERPPTSSAVANPRLAPP